MNQLRCLFYKPFINVMIFFGLCVLSPEVLAITWDPPVVISPLLHEVKEASIVMNQSSDNYIVWSEYEDDIWKIYAMNNWNPSVQISLGTSESHKPQVGIDALGNAMAVWVSFDGSIYTVQTASSNAGEWSQPIIIGSSTTRIFGLELAMNDVGDAVAVWVQSVDRRPVIQAANYNNGVWDASLQISPPNKASSTPSVDIDDSGNIVAIWMTQEPTTNVINIQTAQYVSGIWSPPSVLSGNSERASNPQIAINAVGEGFAVWTASTAGLGNLVFASKFTNGIWGPIETLSTPGISTERLQVVVNQSGNAIVTWLSLVNVFHVNAITFREGVWNSPRILYSVREIKDQPRLTLSNTDRAVMLWTSSTDGNNSLIEGIEYADGTWGSVFLLSDGTKESRIPSVVINDTGEVIGIWKRLERPFSFLLAAMGQA